MKFWSDFLNEVMPYVENCPIPIVEHQLRNAAIDFCQRAALWRKQMDLISIVTDIHTYDISVDLDTDEAISSIDYAYLTESSGETPIGVTTEDILKNNVLNWRTQSATKPNSIMMVNTESFRVFPIPEETIANSLVVGLILKPSRNSSGVPDWIHEQWAEKIACGAKAKLFGMKSRPWYDPNESADEQENFDMAIKDATIRTNKGHSRIDSTVTMRPFA